MRKKTKNICSGIKIHSDMLQQHGAVKVKNISHHVTNKKQHIQLSSKSRGNMLPYLLLTPRGATAKK